MEKYRKVTIIGGGASGMMAGISAADAGFHVTLIDGNNKLGRKLYATGNGRCNFTNIYCNSENYNFPEDGFVDKILSKFTPKDCISFFESLALYAKVEGEGRCYPYTEQATSLVEVLVSGLFNRGVEVITGDAVVSVEKRGSEFSVTCNSGRCFISDALILACGGRAGLQFGSTGDGYGFAKGVGHSLKAPKPALVAFECGDEAIGLMKLVKGLRVKANAKLYEDGKFVKSERGEVQFTGTGVSGICMFDLSRFVDAPRPGNKGKKSPIRDRKKLGELNCENYHEYQVSLDFFPDLSASELMGLVQRFEKDISKFNNKSELFIVLSGLIDKRIAAFLTNQINSENEMDVVNILKDFRIPIAFTKGWDMAQVTRGGIRREEINPETLESLIVPNLYFCGELIDVDGPCGGFNLQWAWASGYIAGKLGV